MTAQRGVQGGESRQPPRFFVFLKEESGKLATENAAKKFIDAAISERDQAEVIAGLGKQGGRGQERIREICLWSDGFSTHVHHAKGKRRPLSFQKVCSFEPALCRD